MINKIIATKLLLLFTIFSYGQTVPDFTITDTENITRSLYADHLNQGQTVVIYLFFTTCPPCNALAPNILELYQDWGSGQYDVEFIEISTQAFDDNADVHASRLSHGYTFPGVGTDGGSTAAALPYKDGTLGPFYGTPSFAVIAPDGTYDYSLNFASLEAAIAATGATGMENNEPDPTTLAITAATPQGTDIDLNDFDFILKPKDSETPTYNIRAITGGSLNFDYPSEDFPELVDPVVVMTTDLPDRSSDLTAADLFLIQKHALQLTPFTEEWKIIAADVNESGSVTAADLFFLQKLILLLDDDFPGDTPSYKTLPAEIPVPYAPGNTMPLDFFIFKVGNAN